MKLLTVKETAQVLRVKPPRVYELIRQRLLPAVKVGHRQIRVAEESLQTWVSQGGSDPRDEGKNVE